MAAKKKAARTLNVDEVNLYELDHAGLVRFATRVHEELTVLRDGRTLLGVERDELDASWAVAADGARAERVRHHRDAERRTAELGGRVRQERAWMVCENGAAEDAARLDGEQAARALTAWYRGQVDQLGGVHVSSSAARVTADVKDGGMAPRHRDRAKRAQLECAKLAKRDADRLDCQMKLVVSLADARLMDACERDEARHGARSKEVQRGYRVGMLARTISRYDEEIASLKHRDRDRFGKAWAPVSGLQSKLLAVTVENRETEMRASEAREQNERLRAEKRAADKANVRLQRKIDESAAVCGGCDASTAEEDVATRRLKAYKTLLDVEQCKNEILAYENAELRRAYRECRGRYDEAILCRRRRDADVAVFSSAGLYRAPGKDVAATVGFPCDDEKHSSGPVGSDKERYNFYGGVTTAIRCQALSK